MPQPGLADAMFLAVANSKIVDIAALPGSGRYPFPVADLISKVVADRLALSGLQLGAADELLRTGQYRSSISRHYYAMYHSARAIAFAFHLGDDFEKHIELPRHLQPTLDDPSRRENELTQARLLRNQADYDPYPAGQLEWEQDARQIASTAADFCLACEDLARVNGHI